MKQVSCEALILRHLASGEADRIVPLFSAWPGPSPGLRLLPAVTADGTGAADSQLIIKRN